MDERDYHGYGPENGAEGESEGGESRGYALAEKIAQLIGMAHEELSEDEWADFCEAFQGEAERVQRLEEGAEEETGEYVDESEFDGGEEDYGGGEDDEAMMSAEDEEPSDGAEMPERGGRPAPADEGDFYGAEYGVEPWQEEGVPEGEEPEGEEPEAGEAGMSPEQRARLIAMLRQRMAR